MGQTIKIAGIHKADCDAIVLSGGPGCPLDTVGNGHPHRWLHEAYRTDGIIGAIRSAVGALGWALDALNPAGAAQRRLAG